MISLNSGAGVSHRGGDTGFTLLEIMVVIAIIALLATIAIPKFLKARQQSQNNACMNNIRVIRDSLTLYKIENKVSGELIITMTDLAPHMKRRPVCPGGGTYSDLGSVPYCTAHDDRAGKNLTAESF